MHGFLLSCSVTGINAAKRWGLFPRPLNLALDLALTIEQGEENMPSTFPQSLRALSHLTKKSGCPEK